MSTERTPVLYVGGLGRSGSTLLNRLLGQVPGHVAVGELVYLWEHSLTRDHECGCGKRFTDCEFWSSVGEHAFGGWHNIDGAEILALQRSVASTTYIPLLVAPWLWPAFNARLQRYADLMGRLFEGIRRASGANVIVDSSKYPAPLYLLRHVRAVDLRVVHIVRDPRGVAYSWSKKVRRPEHGATADEEMPIWSARLVGRRWLTTNTLMALLSKLGVPVLELRYEDFVRDTSSHIRRIVEFMDQPLQPEALSFVGEGWADLVPAHTADGNPMRFATGRIRIRADEAWRQELPEARRRVVETWTWPLRRRYGYGPPERARDLSRV